jgi:FkbM family methyltransferase
MYSILKIKPNLIIHVGADKGQDRAQYLKLGCKNIIWCEADPLNVAYLESKFPNDRVINGIIWDFDEEQRDFYVFENSAQNSAIAPSQELNQSVRRIITNSTHKLDTVINSREILEPVLVVIDVQGAEIEVLTGAANTLNQVEFVVIEIALQPQGYLKAPAQESIYKSLKVFGFKPSIARFSHNESYKDQLFLKGSRVRIMEIQILDSFFNFLMKSRHLILQRHLPKYHYYCESCDGK